MFRPACLGAFSALALLVAPYTSGASILVNGSLEPAQPLPGFYLAVAGGSSVIPGWNTTDSGVEWFSPAGLGSNPAVDGDYVVDLAHLTFSAGGLEQSFCDHPGSCLRRELLARYSGVERT